MIIVSACLVGVNCRYNGKSICHQGVMDYVQGRHWVPVCPEQLGGLTTPRLPSEIEKGTGETVLQHDGRVKSSQGEDVTQAFLKGAEETLRIAQLVGAKEAILKESSPSCGSHLIYDGSFTQQKKPGMGVTAALLHQHSILVKSEVDFESSSESE